MKKILIITFLLVSLKGFGQVFVNDWVTPVTLIPDEVSLLPNKIGTINADENIGPGAYLNYYDFAGNTLSSTLISGIDYNGVSFFSETDDAYYIAGYSTLDSMIFVKTDTIGNVLWRKAFDTNGYEYGVIYQVKQRMDKILVSCTYLTYSSSNVKSALGYFLFDSEGNQIYQSQTKVFPQGTDEYLSYDATFDINGDVFICTTNFNKSFITKYNGGNGQILWSKTYNQSQVESIVSASNDEIIFSGADNLITKIDSDGNIIFEKPIGSGGTHITEQLIYSNNKAYCLGRFVPDGQLFGGAFIGQYNTISGDQNWGWYFDEHALGKEVYGLFSGGLINDSTLIVKGVGAFEMSNYQYFLAQLSIKGVSSVVDKSFSSIPFNVFPNPTVDGIISVQSNRTEGVLTLYDISGKIVWSQPIENRSTIQLPNSGNYVLAYTRQGEKFTQNIIYIRK